MRRVFLALLVSVVAATPAGAQHRRGASENRYDHLFKKYTKRFFGPAFDWRVFKAQAMAESNLRPEATSRVGARGIMQLMPSTYAEIRTTNPELQSIDDPEWNIAAGICYDRWLWRLWAEPLTIEDRRQFMFGSYNAGRGTLLRAQTRARVRDLDHRKWESIAAVAPEVRGWRYRETLDYVRKIREHAARFAGRAAPDPVPGPSPVEDAP